MIEKRGDIMKEIYQFVKLICNDLKIKKPKVEFGKLQTNTMLASYNYKKDIITIKKDYEDIRDLYFSIAHELRHKYQVDRKIFDFDDYKLSDNIDLKNYNLQPQEIDANAYAALIMMSLFSVKPLFKGLDDDVKKEINKRIDKLIR